MVTMNHELANAQKQLKQQREALPPKTRRIADVDPTPKTTTSKESHPAIPVVTSPVATRLRRIRLDDLDVNHHSKVAYAVKMARAWVERKRDGYTDASLILCGPNGVGKTHIARSIWWSVTQCATDTCWDNNGRDITRPVAGTEQPLGLFLMGVDLIAAMGNSTDAKTGMRIPTRPASVIGLPPMVVVDEVGDVDKEQAIPFISAEMQVAERQARLFKFVEYCATLNISVIMTSNLDVDSLAAYLGKSSWDRLAMMAPKLPNGDSFIVDMFGVPSWRLKESGR
jgi:hypothetical protein